MADLDNILIFVKVAQYESISRAARSLGMPISTVSRRLSVLESQLGATLLRRTTRRVSLTAQGRDYFNQCQEPLNLLQEAERVLTQAQKKPEGMLRISVPVVLSQEPFLEFLSAFFKAHPRIRIDLFITNRVPGPGRRKRRCRDPLRRAAGLERGRYPHRARAFAMSSRRRST